ncbi:hypothetical protein AWW67_01065 [Roseivirga seohaensis]|uniref:Lipocalin-like domain-containing protein n=2 Tax=Roseivirga seohaensis TaxID=1914963 RepID=A0A0L8AJI4_9BACT|nr:hypothetical protein [Roseivirga seohaensis]KOF02573.1 hypothetical protein OB69_09570 [Roseivirga seohaensis subsp. aquiponti]KYG84664.1 hypothetical protein AWW67_01065 [Roseivirga seohaensis]
MYTFKNKISRHFELLLLAIVILLITASCGGGGGGDDNPGPSEQELAFDKLKGDWGITNNGKIELDGGNVAANYVGFTLSFTNGAFTTTNAGDLFPATGTWEWVGEGTNQIRTGRGKLVTITSLTTTNFEFSFTKTASNSVAGVSGNYVIKVTK